jgi:Cu+-exporting ATPase
MTEIKKIELKTKGMHCVSCENRIKEAVLSLNGVRGAKVDYVTEKSTIEFDPSKTDVKSIMKAIKDVGYEPEEMNKKESKGFFKKLFG